MKIKFNWQTMKFENLTVAQLEVWTKLYHPVNVFEIITEDMTKWLDKKRNVPSVSRKKDWQRFICNWLKKEQRKAVGL
jgi:hypothetical protein